MSLEGDYHAIRQRLTNGYGSKIEDRGISLRPKPKNDELAAISATLQAILGRLNLLEMAVYERPRPPVTQIDQIIHLLCEHEQISKSELLGSQRVVWVVAIRQMGYYLAAHCTDRSLPQIGHAFGRDHTTVLHGRDKIAEARKSSHELDSRLTWYENRLKAAFAGKLQLCE